MNQENMKKKVDTQFIVVKKSKIHNTGVFARKDIPKGTKVVEYVGEKITKSEAEKRCDKQFRESKNHTKSGGVYVFELNKKYDIDGKVSWNPARYINHSCNPNCEVDLIKGHLWIIALKNIKKDEEITYNYGYDFEDYKEHPCKCGSENCVGYILAKKHWKKLKK